MGKKTPVMESTVKQEGQRKESVNLNVESYNQSELLEQYTENFLSEQSLKDLWDSKKIFSIHIIQVLKKERKWGFPAIMLKHFQILAKYINLQEAKQAPNKQTEPPPQISVKILDSQAFEN